MLHHHHSSSYFYYYYTYASHSVAKVLRCSQGPATLPGKDYVYISQPPLLLQSMGLKSHPPLTGRDHISFPYVFFRTLFTLISD